MEAGLRQKSDSYCKSLTCNPNLSQSQSSPTRIQDNSGLDSHIIPDHAKEERGAKNDAAGCK